MRLIPATDLVILPDRQRKEFDEEYLSELALSIRTSGLLHAAVVRNDGKTLVAGESRVRAMQTYIWPLGMTFTYDGETVPHGHIPVVKVSDLSAIDLEEAELSENLKRRDLTWQEKADATARLHRLRQAQRQVEGAVHSVADTARELTGRADGAYHESVRKDLILSQHLANPAVAAAKTAKDAFKILQKQEEQTRHSALALAVGQTFTADVHQAHNIDCLQWMRRLDGVQGPRFDVILTDPPYGMGADSFGDGAGRMLGIEHHYDDSYESWVPLMKEWAILAYAVAKPQAHAYVFCDPDRFQGLKAFMKAAGWYVFRTPLINVKSNSGRVPLPTMGPRRQYEILLYAIKGDRPTTGIFSDVITSEADEQMGHGAQKPVSLYVDLLRRSVRPGDTVLDSFAGSGTIFPAAHQLKVAATGLELHPASYGKCLERLAALKV